MGGAQYPHEIRPLPRLDREPARRRRRPTRRSEVAAAIGLVLAGVAAIAAIVLVSPAWQRIFVVWRASVTARVAAPSFEILTGLQPSAILPHGLDAEPATAGTRDTSPRPAPEPTPSRPAPAPPRPAQARPVRPPAPSDTTQVMASLLVSQLGQDPAWRTAVANADAHAADSPEHAYWRRVAATIRDGARGR